MKKLIISLILVSCAFETHTSFLKSKDGANKLGSEATSVGHTVGSGATTVKNKTDTELKTKNLDKDGKTLKHHHVGTGALISPTAVGIGTGALISEKVGIGTGTLIPETVV